MRAIRNNWRVAFTWVRPANPSLLAGRPLLDLGTGDGQTLAALAPGPGLTVGVDSSIDLLRRGSVNAAADRLPFPGAAFAAVLAADLFHHLDDARLDAVLEEIARVLRSDGRLIAWWYERPGREAPDAPRYPRSLDAVVERARPTFRDVGALALEPTLEPSPQTVGLTASAPKRAQ